MPDAWVYRDGQRLTPAMLYDFLALDADFARRTGCHLKIRSGVRTDDEQERIWYERMVLAHQVNGRRVYETRWWNGRLWYRISSAGTVAPPGSSNHQINVAAGRRGALDIYDTGSDAGVLTRGSFRANVFDAIAPSYGYDSEGYAFGETWHKRYNRDPWRAVPTGGGSSPEPKQPDKEDDVLIYRCTKDGAKRIALKGGTWIQGTEGPLRQLSDEERDAYAFWNGKGIPVRYADWTGDMIEKQILIYGVREFAGRGSFVDGLSGRIRYDANRVEFPGAHADNPATLTDAQAAAIAAKVSEGIKAGATADQVQSIVNEAFASLTLRAQ